MDSDPKKSGKVRNIVCILLRGMHNLILLAVVLYCCWVSKDGFDRDNVGTKMGVRMKSLITIMTRSRSRIYSICCTRIAHCYGGLFIQSLNEICHV